MTEYTRYILIWMPGWPELLIILVIALLIFGKKLPEVARSLGRSLNELKKGIREGEEVKEDLEKQVKEIKDDVVREVKDAAGLNNSDKNN